jgi:hypothetical protein
VSQAASQAWAFYREVAANEKVWTVRDANGFPAPKTSSGKRAQPFWSSLSRVKRVIRSVPAYAGFEPYEVPWNEFCNGWVPDLTGKELLIGVNWSGRHAIGYDLDPTLVVQYVKGVMQEKVEHNDDE